MPRRISGSGDGLISASPTAVAKVSRMSVDAIEDRIEAWVRSHVAGFETSSVRKIHSPAATGLSGDTFIVGMDDAPHDLVIRKDTVDKATNPQSCFATLARAQTILSASGDLPVPRVLALETGKDVLGAPFLAMEFVTGQIPSDVPSYAAGGWVRDALPGQRRRMWESGLDFMVALHALDWRALRLGELRFEEAGRDDVERCLKRSINLYRQEAGDRVSDLAERAIAWLITNRPETAESCICWGDARIGNMIWRDFTPAAVIDWEMASLGVPAMDLGWWSFFHRWATSGQGHAVLEGMPVGTELAALYAARGGRPIDDILYYEILATVRGLSIWIRTYDVMTAGTPAAEASPIADGVHIMTVLDTLMTDIPTRKTG